MEIQIIKVMPGFEVGGDCCEGTEIWILVFRKILFLFYFACYFDPKRKIFVTLLADVCILVYFFTEKSYLGRFNFFTLKKKQAMYLRVLFCSRSWYCLCDSVYYKVCNFIEEPFN